MDNIAAAIALAVTDNRAAGRIYNLGEPTTPTLLVRFCDTILRVVMPLSDREGTIPGGGDWI